MSEYYQSLEGNVKCRYSDKVRIIDSLDPYLLKQSDCCSDLKKLPPIELIDIVNYFTLSHSFYTGKQLKAFKSLEAYKYCKSGFVTNVCFVEKCNNFVVIGEVKHSQKMNEKPLKPWLIISKDGSIYCAHCNCMAGLGEVCSHVAAIAFYLLCLNSDTDSQSCTSKLSVWPVPKFTKTIVPQKIKDIDWGKRMKSFDNIQQPNIPPLQGNDLHNFLRQLEEHEPKAVIFSVRQPYAANRAPPTIQYLPKPLTDLFNKDTYQDYNLDELQCIEIPNLSQAERELVQKETIEQSKSKLWFDYRAGRVTGSLFKSVCKTPVDNPSISLIKRICYPLKMTFKTKAIIYGVDNEKVALETYKSHVSGKHENVKLSSVGLCISQNSCIAATPDAMIQCDCCGIGCVEVKCPFRMLDKDINIEKFAEMDKKMLVRLADGSFSLNKNHSYFYQVQLQMYATETSYCDFFLWSKKECFIERIYLDQEFLQVNIETAKRFHTNCIIPELLTNWFTKSTSLEPERWCECRGIEDGRKMVRCANEDCEIQWFHYSCVNIKKMTQDTYWFCKKCSLDLFSDTNVE